MLVCYGCFISFYNIYIMLTKVVYYEANSLNQHKLLPTQEYKIPSCDTETKFYLEELNGSPIQQSPNKNKSTGPNKKLPTTTRRKLETAVLLKEVQSLEEYANSLKQLAGKPSINDELLLAKAKQDNFTLKEYLKHQQNAIVSLQKLFTERMSPGVWNPLEREIILTKDHEERIKTLHNLKEVVLMQGYNYLQQRLGHLDSLKPYFMKERHTNEHGDLCLQRLEVVQFRNVQSVKQVFDVWCDFINNIEINVSGITGYVSIREDYETMDKDITYSRFVSPRHGKYPKELKRLNYTKFEINPHTGQEHGLLVNVPVTEDHIHPYMPDQRIQMRASLAWDFYSCTQQRIAPDGSCYNEFVVCVKALCFYTIVRPQWYISDEDFEYFFNDLPNFGDVMISNIRQTLRMAKN